MNFEYNAIFEKKISIIITRLITLGFLFWGCEWVVGFFAKCTETILLKKNPSE